MTIQWTDLALADLEEIEAWVTRDNSAVVAVNVVLKIIDSIENILERYPQAGRPGRVEGTRELIVSGIPWLVVYRGTAADIQVLRVLHDAQEWPGAP